MLAVQSYTAEVREPTVWKQKQTITVSLEKRTSFTMFSLWIWCYHYLFLIPLFFLSLSLMQFPHGGSNKGFLFSILLWGSRPINKLVFSSSENEALESPEPADMSTNHCAPLQILFILSPVGNLNHYWPNCIVHYGPFKSSSNDSLIRLISFSGLKKVNSKMSVKESQLHFLHVPFFF